MFSLESLVKIAEGKTKAIYAHPADPNTVIMYLNDDITAGDGLKHDVIPGKAVLDWRVNRDAFELFNRSGLPTHYVSSPAERFVVVKRLQRKINLEVVSRRVATGSIVRWGSMAEGTRFDPVATEFHYKDDFLHDPKLDDRFLKHLIQTKGSREYSAMAELNERAFILLEAEFAKLGFQLIDMKLEYGIVDGKVCIIDEVSAGSIRIWPYRFESPNLDQNNLLAVLAPEGRLDKDLYRQGQPLDKVFAGFQKVAELTGQFAVR